jgi:hypothetical protein
VFVGRMRPDSRRSISASSTRNSVSRSLQLNGLEPDHSAFGHLAIAACSAVLGALTHHHLFAFNRPELSRPAWC